VTKLYEVVRGQILLHKQKEFFRLHHEVLLPIMKEVGIKPLLLLITEVGEFGKFLDVYEYADFADYEARTNQLIQHPSFVDYYEQVGLCIQGSITVELMKNLPYAPSWT
jgi:hypothetical protein